MTGKKQNMAPMWKKLMKTVDLDEPTSFLDHVYLGCTQRECKPNENHHWGIQKNARITNFCWCNWKFTRVGKTSRKDGYVVRTTWKDMLENALRDISNWQRKRQQLDKVSSPCLDDQHFKKEELEYVGELSKVCSQIVLKCLFMARNGRSDILTFSKKTCSFRPTC